MQLRQTDARFCPPSLAAPHILFVFVSLGFERKPETFLSCCRFNAQMFRCKLSQPDWKRLFPTNAHLGRGSGWSLPFSHCLGACCLGTWNQSPCYTLCFWGSLLKLLPETSRSFNTVLRTCDDPFCRNADEDVRLGFYDGKLNVHIEFLLESPTSSPVILYSSIGSLIFGLGWMDGEPNML